jgi:2'-5' RNA ligase
MRLFFGIGLPAYIRQQILVFTEILRPQLPRMKWVQAHNLHVTLRFLGEVEESRVASVCMQARDAAARLSQFQVTFGELGAFASPSRARVFWWGLSGGVPESTRLFNRLEEGLERLGFEPERNRYHPHLTLARLRYVDSLPLKSFSPPVGISFTASSFTLYQSSLTPQGPIYKIVEEFKFG